MRFSKLVSAFLFASSVAAYSSTRRTFAVNHFYGKGPLVTTRVDPIVNPGGPAGHVHTIQGGNNFAMTMSENQALESTCTSSLVKNDKSNYWTPSLYFHAENGSFIAVPMFYMNVYYFFDATDDKILAFPPGLRMLVGNPSARSPPPTGGRTILDFSDGTPQPIHWTCPRSNPNDPLYPPNSDGLHGVGIQDPSNKGVGVGFSDKNCDGYASPLRADLHFPSCYDPSKGVNDYKNNMQFPTNGNCPKGWIHVPHMFYEVYWNTLLFSDLWTPGEGKQPFVLSNGDPTGYSLHGDFISGWDVETLQQIIDNCDAGSAGIDKCPGLIGGINDRGNSCNIPSPIDEVTDGVLEKLPGNNPVGTWGANIPGVPSPVETQAAAPSRSSSRPTTSSGTPSPPAVGSTGVAGGSGSRGNGQPRPSNSGSGQRPTTQPSRAVSTSRVDGQPLPAPTRAPSGALNGGNRNVVTSLVSQTTVVYTTTTAPGAAPSVDSKFEDGRLSYSGCFSDNKAGARVLSGIKFANLGHRAVTNTKCVAYCAKRGFSLAGTEYGGQCFCGNEIIGSSPVDESLCNMPCEGDKSETCGGKLTLSLYKTSVVARRSLHLHRHLHGRRPLR